jgi:hypothetical protein
MWLPVADEMFPRNGKATDYRVTADDGTGALRSLLRVGFDEAIIWPTLYATGVVFFLLCQVKVVVCCGVR